MAVTLSLFCALLTVVIKCSIAEIHLNTFKVKGGDRSLLQSMNADDRDIAQTINCGDALGGSYDTSPVFYEFINHESQQVTFADCNTGFDATLWIYNESLEWISGTACNNGGDDCDPRGLCTSYSNRESISMILDPGRYYIELRSYSTRDAAGEYYEITVDCTTPYPSQSPVYTTQEPSRAPTQIIGDLSICDESIEISVPISNDDISFWFSVDSTQNPIIGIDVCGNENNFVFVMELLTNPDDYSVSYSDYSAGICGNDNIGAYLEIDTTHDYQNWWLRVRTIYQNNNFNLKLNLTGRCEIKYFAPATNKVINATMTTPIDAMYQSTGIEYQNRIINCPSLYCHIYCNSAEYACANMVIDASNATSLILECGTHFSTCQNISIIRAPSEYANIYCGSERACHGSEFYLDGANNFILDSSADGAVSKVIIHAQNMASSATISVNCHTVGSCTGGLDIFAPDLNIFVNATVHLNCFVDGACGNNTQLGIPSIFWDQSQLQLTCGHCKMNGDASMTNLSCNSNGVVTCAYNNVECCSFNTHSYGTPTPTTAPTDNGGTLILKQGDLCIDGYKEASNDAYCELCGVNEAGRHGSCDECGNGKQANDNHTKCVLCDDNFIGVNGYCDIDCTQSNKITNELHTECVIREKEYWYTTAEFDAVVSVIGVLTGFSCIGAFLYAYCKKQCCAKPKDTNNVKDTKDVTDKNNEIKNLNTGHTNEHVVVVYTNQH